MGTQIRLSSADHGIYGCRTSYASNEVAINWNAPATVIFAILDYVLGEK